MTSLASAKLQLMLCALFVIGQFLEFPTLARRLLALSLIAMALSAHTDGGRWHGQRPRIHFWDFYHYNIATKWFSQVGYFGLYEATVIADAEDAQVSLNLPVRNMRNYLFEPRSQIVEKRDSILQNFSPRDWGAFKQDVAAYRSLDPGAFSVNPLVDHGYCGTPLTTVICGTLPRVFRWPSANFVGPASWIDPILLATTAILVGLGISWNAAFLFLFVLLVNPLNDYAVVGGSYLRYGFLCAMVLGVVAMSKGAQRTAGILLAFSVQLRLYPILWVLSLLIGDLVARDWRQQLRITRPFWIAFIVTSVALSTFLCALATPEGHLVWLDYFQKMSRHSSDWSLNTVGLRYPFFYSEAGNVVSIMDRRASGENVNWLFEAKRTFSIWRPAWMLVTLGLFLLAVKALKRNAKREQGSRMVALAIGVVPMFCLLQVSHYDWMVLAVLPVCLHQNRTALTALAMGLGSICLTRFLPCTEQVLDLRFMAYSCGIFVTVFAVLIAIAQEKEVALEPEFMSETTGSAS